MAHKYEIIMYWSEEDEAFLAEVPELPGCVVDGQSYQEALAEAQTVMDLWIDASKSFGREIPKPLGRRLAYTPGSPLSPQPEQTEGMSQCNANTNSSYTGAPKTTPTSPKSRSYPDAKGAGLATKRR